MPAVGYLARRVLARLVENPIDKAMQEYEEQLSEGWKIRLRHMNDTSVHLLDLHGRVLSHAKGIPIKEADALIRSWIQEHQDDKVSKEGEAWAALDAIQILYPHVREAWDAQKTPTILTGRYS